jgi:hypothetical protein
LEDFGGLAVPTICCGQFEGRDVSLKRPRGTNLFDASSLFPLDLVFPVHTYA